MQEVALAFLGGPAASGGMSAIDTLPPLRQVIADHGLRAKKSLGQNFLLDLNLTAKIARLAGDLPIVTLFGVEELSLALGRENVVHAVLTSGGLADRFLRESNRLADFCEDRNIVRNAQEEMN